MTRLRDLAPLRAAEAISAIEATADSKTGRHIQQTSEGVYPPQPPQVRPRRRGEHLVQPQNPATRNLCGGYQSKNSRAKRCTVDDTCPTATGRRCS